jgi:hypothetical protein
MEGRGDEATHIRRESCYFVRATAGDGNNIATVIFSFPLLDGLTGRAVNLHYRSLEALMVLGRLKGMNKLSDLVGLYGPSGLVDK